MQGFQHHDAGGSLVRHRHAAGYAALVLSGSYLEAGDRGRVRVHAGEVVFHAGHEAHRNEFATRGARILNLPWTGAVDVVTAAVTDVDAVARLAGRDVREAVDTLRRSLRPTHAALDDWPDRLAIALAGPEAFALADWADEHGLAAPSVSRGFRRAYGVSPKRFRLELRALRTIHRLTCWSGSLADLAAEEGFADQAHLCRTVASITGFPPGHLRVQSVQDTEGSRP